MTVTRELLPLLRDMSLRLDGAHSLRALAARAGRTPFQIHRLFRSAFGETPKQYLLRIRLELAAAKLAVTRDSVLDIALGLGFGSHEVFTRAFRRHFGRTPARYRATVPSRANVAARSRHLAMTRAISPCIRLHHIPQKGEPRRLAMPTLSIERKTLAQQPILFIRRKVARSEIASMLGECYGKLFGHGHQAGLPIAGWPLARYVSVGAGLLTVDAAMPLAAPASGDGEMQAGFLPGGPVVLAIHGGPYDQLPETHAAIERWIETKGARASGPPWECYVTDPAEHPDPADWRTEVYWPLTE
jgi:AraC family transcriptional regulator